MPEKQNLPDGREFELAAVGRDVQLLLDNHVVDDVWMVRRSPELPLKCRKNPVLISGPPMEGCTVVAQSVLYDDEDKLFKMWYTISDSVAPPPGIRRVTRPAYAVSEDGVHWEKPNLGLVEWKGSKDNNLLLENGVPSVIKDPADPDPSRRYKMLAKHSRSVGGRVFAYFSPDGIHWTRHPSERSVIPGAGDGTPSIVFDPCLGKYVVFLRPSVLAAKKLLQPDEIGFSEADLRKRVAAVPTRATTEEEALEREGMDEEEIIYEYEQVIKNRPRKKDPADEPLFPAEEDIVSHHEAEDYIHRYMQPVPYHFPQALRRPFKEIGMGCNRRIARAESADFVNWSVPEVVVHPDELDPPRFYNMTVTLYGGMYVGLLQVYSHWSGLRTMGQCRDQEIIELQLAFSRDGKRWERLANRPVFLPPGMIGEFDGGMIRAATPPLVEYGDELRIYYDGNPTSHNVKTFDGRAVGLARLPRERIVARVAGEELGVLITKPFVLEGGSLAVNADARRGLLKVEVADVDGNPLPGFGAKDAQEIRENGFRLPVGWGGGNSLESLRGRPVRLRFFMWRTRLYSFCFS